MSDTLLPEDIVSLATRVVRENEAAGRKVAVAESCTGGLVGAALTAVAGSSVVFDRGFITYSNASKEAVLGVSPDILEAFGAVSVACAWAMAQGAIRESDADVAVAVSGIAGPDGGTDLKPVGLVVLARALRDCTPDEIKAEEMRFESDTRDGVRHQATLAALELLLP